MGHTNHRRGDVKGNDRQTVAFGCCDEGANGKRGRTKWKRLSHRAARRNAKQGNGASRIQMRPKTHNRWQPSPVLKRAPPKEE